VVNRDYVHYPWPMPFRRLPKRLSRSESNDNDPLSSRTSCALGALVGSANPATRRKAMSAVDSDHATETIQGNMSQLGASERLSPADAK
jgi:hypothetical protein